MRRPVLENVVARHVKKKPGSVQRRLGNVKKRLTNVTKSLGNGMKRLGNAIETSFPENVAARIETRAVIAAVLLIDGAHLLRL